ncbi:MAG: glycoside hydrolase family 71/99-like protein [Candidatus Latescibacterota bacterium]
MTLVHYMPWFSSEPVSGDWGWHWTMGHFDPGRLTDDGNREVAAHDYPLIGPYDSSDPDVLEYHVLLMKLAGIDGAIVDWYGIRDFEDYAVIHRNTEHLITYLRMAGLKFAVCYEDQTVRHMVEGGVLLAGQDVAHGTEVFEWLQQNWFAEDVYLKVDGGPVLLVFGPQHFAKAQWEEITAGLRPPPRLYALPHLSREAGADGTFGWPPVNGGGEVTPAAWRYYLSALYARGRQGESVIAPVFPKFHDIYEEAGLHDSYGTLDDREGETFGETLDRAWESPSRMIQIITWNDHGEGTAIEPTAADGYRYLEAVQRRRMQNHEMFAFGAQDLRLPLKLYDLRKQTLGDPAATQLLDRAASLILAADCDAARELLTDAVSLSRR